MDIVGNRPLFSPHIYQHECSMHSWLSKKSCTAPLRWMYCMFGGFRPSSDNYEVSFCAGVRYSEVSGQAKLVWVSLGQQCPLFGGYRTSSMVNSIGVFLSGRRLAPSLYYGHVCE
jgi:hypothetical protein